MSAKDALPAFGTAGWSYPDWLGPVYERRGEGLELLARVFDVVEVNSTFYHAPTAAHASGWLRKVSHNPTFQFTAKLWQGFTHGREFAAKDVASYRNGIEPLVEAEKLGALLMQFPWSFKYESMTVGHVERLAQAFSGLPLVAEFRHRSWGTVTVLRQLRDLGVGFCNIDQPLVSDSLGPMQELTSDIGYVRLHGRNADNWFREGAGRDARYDYLYQEAELRPWTARIKRLSERARRVFVITNNHFGGSAVQNALELRHLHDGARREVPSRWLDSFPRLRHICSPVRSPQGELFG